MSTRGPRAGWLALLLALAAAGGGREPSVSSPTTRRAELLARLDEALRRGGAWLEAQRRADGCWRSRRYRALADDWSLSLPALKALAYTPDLPGARAALEEGVERLCAAAERGLEHEPLDYPVYSCSLAVLVLAAQSRAGEGEDPRIARAREAWLARLCAQRFDADKGWSPAEFSFGGFGGGPLPPRRAGRYLEADLSSTLFALGALRASGVASDDPRVREALGFVLRCQNLPLADDAPREPALDDGGFFLSPADGARDKAGALGVDRSGRVRYRSYASATADGLRALLAAGLPHEHPRVRAARASLERCFDPARNGGEFPPERRVERDSSRFYAAWSAAHAFARLAQAGAPSARAWAEPLAFSLLSEQRPDGSFANDASVLLEDEPLVATPLALGALASCRLALAGAAP